MRKKHHFKGAKHNEEKAPFWGANHTLKEKKKKKKERNQTFQRRVKHNEVKTRSGGEL